jgi:DNA/RNA-binding domain of Phe-tRNA-synthetase-like protein
VTVVDRDPAMDEPLRAAAVSMRARTESAETTAAVRTMYKRVGIDPTKTRPSSEACCVASVAVTNCRASTHSWMSSTGVHWKTQLPFGLYDLDHIRGNVELRIGRDGEEYAGIRKDTVHVAGRLTLSDDQGPFGNPTSDSARTMVTTATTRTLVVIFCPASVGRTELSRALELTRSRIPGARFS